MVAAIKLLEFTWDQALWSQEAIVYKTIGLQRKSTTSNSWKTSIGRLIEGYESEFLNNTRRDAEHELYVKYASAILSRGLRIYSKPTFLINCTESFKRLTIQKKYETQREALLMTNDESTLSFSNVEALRKVDGRRIYRGCVITSSHLSIDAELRELNDVGDAVTTRKVWLPELIAELGDMSTAGVPFGEEECWEWDEYFQNLGCKRAEELALESEPAQLQPLQQPGQPRNPAPANCLPPSRHGRPNPFHPTHQPTLTSREGVKTKYSKTKGHPPGGVDFFECDLAYNRADSHGRRSGKALHMRGRDRNSGKIRDIVIDDLIGKGLLPVGFQDLNP
ncbi:hypothetical protein IFR05_012240 [Cadophora sp. M221]|nr:hypothetical protein IFR05_012240 [Cadophora sp. M221]